jgi:hypothetical protein
MEIADPPRTLDQNSRMWPMLTDISKQLQWLVDGELQWLTPEDWKTMMTAGLKREQRIAKGIWGGFVVLGISTSRMKKKEMSELIELMFAFGAEHGIVWSDPTQPPIEAYARAA